MEHTHRSCTKCYQTKELKCFSKSSKNKKYGVRAICKICVSNEYVILKANYEEKFNESFSDKLKRDYNSKTDQEKIEDNKKRYRNSKSKNIERSKKWIINNKERYLASVRLSRKKNQESNPIIKLKARLHGAVSKAFSSSGFKKNCKALQILGEDLHIIKTHLERQFKKGMTWENHTMKGWHIDHIIPLSSAKTEEELINLCHYTNLQPLWAKDNILKSNKIPQVQTKLTL